MRISQLSILLTHMRFLYENLSAINQMRFLYENPSIINQMKLLYEDFSVINIAHCQAHRNSIVYLVANRRRSEK
jgi:Ni,Fe-hydrogenase I small subunit